MKKSTNQRGSIYESNNAAFHIRYYVSEGGSRRKQRSHKLCAKDDLHPSKDSPSVVALAEAFMLTINEANTINDAQPFHNCPICGRRCKRNLKGQITKQGEDSQ